MPAVWSVSFRLNSRVVHSCLKDDFKYNSPTLYEILIFKINCLSQYHYSHLKWFIYQLFMAFIFTVLMHFMDQLGPCFLCLIMQIPSQHLLPGHWGRRQDAPQSLFLPWPLLPALNPDWEPPNLLPRCSSGCLSLILLTGHMASKTGVRHLRDGACWAQCTRSKISTQTLSVIGLGLVFKTTELGLVDSAIAKTSTGKD